VILRFLREILEFTVEFLGFFLAPPICSCCSRGVEGKVVEKVEVFGGAMGDGWWSDGWFVAVERLGCGALRASPFIAVFGCLCCGVEE
jgi:hypothetical protein